MLPTLSVAQPQPAYQLLVDGNDISPKIRQRLIVLTLTDNRRFEADTIDIVLDDSDGKLAFPSKGAKMQVFIGWQGQPLIDKGIFTIDEIEHSGPPDTLTLRGKAADIRDSLQLLREQSYHGNTLGDILKTIAGRNELASNIAEHFASEAIDHIDQQNESDAAFLTRLALQFDAVATIKHDSLLFFKAGSSTTASGKPLAQVTLTRQSGDSHRFAVADRHAYSGVKAVWQDNDAASKRIIQVIREKKGKTKEDASTEFIIGSTDNIKVLRQTYSNQKAAERAAKAEWQRLQRNVASFSITLAKGQPELFPEVPIKVQGFKPDIDTLPWLLTKVTHQINDSGYTTALELEVKNNDVPEVEEVDDTEDIDQAPYNDD